MSNNITNTVFFLKQSTRDLARKKEFPRMTEMTFNAR